ncbi:MAG: hypothetical protein V4568_14375 [Pseudomonadota bacterium]
MTLNLSLLCRCGGRIFGSILFVLLAMLIGCGGGGGGGNSSDNGASGTTSGTATSTTSGSSATLTWEPAPFTWSSGTGCSTTSGASSRSADPVASNMELLAGNVGGPGDADGTGTAASVNRSHGLATDRVGNIYVADTVNHTIRKISPTGVVSTVAGTAGRNGCADGIGAAASFYYPDGLATDSVGNIYVADTANSTIRKITPTGVVSTIAGTPGIGGSADGTGAAATFSIPYGIATDSAGNIYVADQFNSTIRKITPEGMVTTIAGTAGITGSADGTGAAASFYYPAGLATDKLDNIYVADRWNSTIRKITPAGIVTTIAGTPGIAGSADGTGAAASFNHPAGLTTDGAGNIYVADSGNSTMRKITPEGVVTTIAGTPYIMGSADGTGAAASFNYPAGLTTDGAGNIYVADIENSTIRKITPAGVVTTIVGTAGKTGATDGIGAAASFNQPYGLTTDSAGHVYVADTFNNTIRKITPTGLVSTLAGSTGTWGSADGAGAAASFTNFYGLAADSTGNIFVADRGSHTIRKVTPAGIVTTIAGTLYSRGSADGAGTAASFNNPAGIATDSVGNIFVTDSESHTIRKVTPAGIVTTIAGTASSIAGSADGTGTTASFNNPVGIATDSVGNIYVADTGNSAIRRITPDGVVTTIAGTAGHVGSADGTGAGASFNNPIGIATDSVGNIYVADTGNNTIRRITPGGVVTTIAGAAGRTGSALSGFLSSPRGITVDANGAIYVSTANGIVKMTL